MKTWRFSAFSLFVLFNTFAFAQISKPEKGSVWVYEYRNIGSRGPVLSTYDRDSTVGGKNGMVISEKLYDVYTDPGRLNLVIRTLTGKILYIEDSVVYYFSDSQYDTLINFGAAVGEGWTNDAFEDLITVNVLGKGADSLLGSFLDIEYSFWQDWTYRDTVYERLLGGREYPIPRDYLSSQLDGHEGGPLTCFSNSKGRYSEKTWTAGGVACTDIIDKLSVGEVSQTKLFSLYPNPSNGTIRILGNRQPQKIEIFSAMGQRVYSSENTFEIDNLSPQIYFVKIWRNDGKVESHRVVVE